MELLAALEPQLAIPVLLVIIGAVLVYLFGFKPTEEPSLEHLAVLHKPTSKHGGSKGSAASSRSSSKPKANGTVSNGVKKVGNGNVPHVPKERTAPAPTSVPVPKVEKKNLRDPANKPEDFETGEWIPAVSRKDKSKKVNKEAPQSPKKAGPNKVAVATEETSAPAVVVAATATAATGKAPRIEDLLAEMNALKQAGQPVVIAPEKKTKEGKANKVQQKEEPKVVVPPPKEEVKEEPAKKEAAAGDFKSNIAFDEMGGGDAWEEAKSRGAKKRRTRRD